MNARIALGGIALIGCTLGALESSATAPGPAPDLAQVRQRVAALSVPFVPNAGQWDARAAFAAHTFAGTLFVTTEGQLVYSLPGTAIDEAAADALDDGPASRPTHQPRQSRARTRGPGGVLTETLVDAEGHALLLTPRGDHPQNAKVSYFIGHAASRHRSALDTFERVSLGELAPGIALQLRATGSNVEKIFTVAPVRDPRSIRVRLGGAERLELGADGELIVHTGRGPVVYTAPIAFQEDTGGKRSNVPVRYALAAHDETYGFVVGDYDRALPLVIDPLLQATYAGGTTDFTNSSTFIAAIAIDPASGDVLVAGHADSANVLCTTTATPGCANGAQPVHASGHDGYVARLDANLTTMVQATYLGGSGEDEIYAIAIHPVSGEVLVAGVTSSTDLPCTGPATIGCINGAQPARAGAGAVTDGFVARLSVNLTRLLQATYLGGSNADQINAIAVHPVSGEVLVAGVTNSTDLPCTTVASGCGTGAQAAFGGLNFNFPDGFVARLNANLTSLLQATYFGDLLAETITAIAVHPVSGEVLVAGSTSSANLPCTPIVTLGCGNGAQPTYGGGNTDGFVARLSTDLTNRLQTTYLGGGGEDHIVALAIHPVSGEVLVAGQTFSTNLPCTTANLPTGCGTGAQSAHAPDSVSGFFKRDGFAARLNASLTSFLQATYLGGNGDDSITALAIHPNGEVLVAGWTTSTNLPCTTTATAGCGTGARSTHAGGPSPNDGFAARLNGSLTSLLQATYLGGSLADSINTIAVHPPSGHVLVAGETYSANLPCTNVGTPGCLAGAQPGATGGSPISGFVARFTADLALSGIAPNPFAFTSQTNVPLGSVRTSNPVQITGFVGTATLYVGGQPGSTYCVSSTNACTCDVSAGFIATPGSITADNYACVRHTASTAGDQLTRTNLHVGNGVGAFLVTTVAPICNLDANNDGHLDGEDRIATLFQMFVGSENLRISGLDVDGNGSVDALTDGLLLFRALSGLTGPMVTNHVIGAGATRTTWAQIQPYLNAKCGTNLAP